MSIHVAPRPAAPTNAPLKAGPIGSGAGVLLTEYPLSSRLGQDPLRKMRTAFQMGFLIFVPFILIDLVVATVLMSMGMMMMPPTTISIPLKLLLFVLVDGWSLVIQSLVRSFGM